MGKANRRRASRGATVTEQTQQSQARQTTAAPLPTDPGKAPEDCTYFGYRRWAERKYGRLGKPAVPGAAPAIDDCRLQVPSIKWEKTFSLGLWCGFWLYPGGFFSGSYSPLDMCQFDLSRKVERKGLLALKSWAVVLGVILGVAIDWVLRVTSLFLSRFRWRFIEMFGVAFAASFCYSLPWYAYVVRFAIWDTTASVCVTRDAPVPARILAIAYECRLVAPYLVRGGLDPLFSSATGFCIVLAVFFWNSIMLNFFGRFWIGASCLCSRFIAPTVGFAMFFCTVLSQVLETLSPSTFYETWNNPSYSNWTWRVQRWEDYDHGKTARLPFWRAYHRERGHEKELKQMEKLERRTCDVCGLVGAANGPRFGVCDLCGERRYCSILCQRTDWKIFDHSEKCDGLENRFI